MAALAFAQHSRPAFQPSLIIGRLWTERLRLLADQMATMPIDLWAEPDEDAGIFLTGCIMEIEDALIDGDRPAPPERRLSAAIRIWLDDMRDDLIDCVQRLGRPGARADVESIVVELAGHLRLIVRTATT